MTDAAPAIGNAAQPATPTEGSLSKSDIAHFEAIAQFAHRTAGLVLSRDKAPMVLARVGKRMRALGLESLGDYHDYLSSDAGDAERSELLFALTTNVTSFFREKHHFDVLRDSLLPALARRARSGDRIRLWSAGCSTGQEPYSLAMTILEALPEAPRCDIRILATDIDRKVLARARAGTFDAGQAETVPEALRRKYLLPVATSRAGHPASSAYQVSDDLRGIVVFRELNLLEEWPMRGKFDAIFCRNVVIYFDRDTQARLWPKFAKALQPDGLLFLGHSERIDTAQFPQFRPAGTTYYQLDGAIGHDVRRAPEWH